MARETSSKVSGVSDGRRKQTTSSVSEARLRVDGMRRDGAGEQNQNETDNSERESDETRLPDDASA